MFRFTHHAAAVAACLAMAVAANAQDQSSGTSSAQPAGSSQQGANSPAAKLDHNFLKQAAIDNLFEIQLSQLAQKQAQDEKVKQFAEMMVKDHTQASEQLKQVAQKKQVQLPTDLPEVKKEEVQIFQSLQGSEFDQAYLGCMRVAHVKDVAAFENKAKHAKDQDVKQFAAQTLPKLQQHKQHVMAMTGGGDEAQTAGSKQQGASGTSDSDRQNQKSGSGSSGSSGSSSGTSSSGSGSRETGSGTATGGGTTGAGSQ